MGTCSEVSVQAAEIGFWKRCAPPMARPELLVQRDHRRVRVVCQAPQRGSLERQSCAVGAAFGTAHTVRRLG